MDRLNDITDDNNSASTERLEHLSNFQVTCLKHALTFPKVKRVVYSTCSIHQQENEDVVNEVLSQAQNFKAVPVLPDWPHRGEGDHIHSKCFLRMAPDTSLTNGFFVACIERTSGIEEDFHETNDSDTQGDINIDNSDDTSEPEMTSKKHKKKKKKKTVEDELEMEGDEDNHKKEKKRKKRESALENGSIDDNEISKNKAKKRKHRDDISVDRDIQFIEDNVEESDTHKRKKNKKHKHERNVEDDQHIECIVDGEETDTHKRKKHKKHKHERNVEDDQHVECMVDGEESVKHRHKKNKKHKQ